MNITLSIDEGVVKKVRKIAVDQDTTLTALVRDYLVTVAKKGSPNRVALAKEFRKTVKDLGRDMGPRAWRREDLYER